MQGGVTAFKNSERRKRDFSCWNFQKEFELLGVLSILDQSTLIKDHRLTFYFLPVFRLLLALLMPVGGGIHAINKAMRIYLQCRIIP